MDQPSGLADQSGAAANIEEGITRKALHMLRPYSLLILRRDDSVLLLKRQNTEFGNGCYSLVGGKLEPHETFLRAIIREAKEEIGISLSENDVSCAHVFQRQGTENELVVLVFSATTWQGDPVNNEPDKCSELKWFALNNVPDNIIPAHKQALEMIAKGVLYSEHNYKVD
jgi:ADP-ribose pyrophosphatase YjhB (NUDIX family)